MAGQGRGKKLSLVVAMCNNRGIGINGKVPWRIRGDMEFFKTITTVTQDEAKKNAVIMGRKTWDSIPSKFRPLPGRVNIVLSRTLEKSPEGAHVVKSWDEAMELVNGPTMVDQIEHVFIVGGSAIYEMALASPACYRVYLTRVLTEVECDTFFPSFNNDSFKLTKDENIDDTIRKENNLEYKIEVYEKPMFEASEWKTFNIVAAMMDSNRGIGIEGRLPWPFLRKDYEYYNRLCSEPKEPGKLKVNIKGLQTWNSTNQEEKLWNGKMNVVLSSKLVETPENCHFLARTAEQALRWCNTPPASDQIDSIFVMGGESVYEAMMTHPLCDRVYLTRIYYNTKADTFFPVFEDYFVKINDPEVDGVMQEDNGIQYQFEVWEHRSLSHC